MSRAHGRGGLRRLFRPCMGGHVILEGGRDGGPATTTTTEKRDVAAVASLINHYTPGARVRGTGHLYAKHSIRDSMHAMHSAFRFNL